MEMNKFNKKTIKNRIRNNKIKMNRNNKRNKKNKNLENQ